MGAFQILTKKDSSRSKEEPVMEVMTYEILHRNCRSRKDVNKEGDPNRRNDAAAYRCGALRKCRCSFSELTSKYHIGAEINVNRPRQDCDITCLP
jgi:hypothetical protein